MFDIEPFVYRHFPEAKPYGTPVTDLSVNCPFCGDDKLHLNVSLMKQATHCFRCGYKANYIQFVMAYTGYDYHKALGELYVKPKLRILEGNLKQIVEEDSTQANSLPEGFTNLLDCQSRMGPTARNYMRRRGLGKALWKRFNIGYAESIPNRIIIPIEDDYWQGRRIFDWMDPKYVNPKAPAREALFNSRALMQFNEVIVCEGAFSAMAVGNNAIALIGKEPTEEKCSRIAASVAERFIIALEPGAYKSIKILAQKLARAGKEVIIWNYSVGDPNDPKAKFDIVTYDLKGRVNLELYV